MTETATGLILRKRRLTETSLILHWLTEEHGRLATVAKGALRAKSPLRGRLDLFYEADFSFSRSRRSELHTLREVNPVNLHAGLRTRIEYLEQACYCAELVELTTELETPLPGLFEMVRKLLAQLTEMEPNPVTVFAFEIQMLEYLGLEPNLEETALSAGGKALLKTLETGHWPLIGRLATSKSQEMELSRFLHEFLVYHLGRVPRGREDALRICARQTG
jgi:DNA repair protein RecO (recombination protein O)